MRFREDKTYHILQLADIQEIPRVSKDTLRLIERALEQTQPDLVVLTGDQIKGQHRAFRQHPERVEETLRTILAPVVRRGIPFVVTFGNHDEQCGLGNERQMDIYRTIPGCVDWLNNRGNRVLHGTQEGTCALGIEHSDGGGTAMAVYLFDTGGNQTGGGYGAPKARQFQWFRQVRDQLEQENGACVPGIVFQHIPMPEYYRMLRRTHAKDKGAVRTYRTHANEYYVPDPVKCRAGELLEAVSGPDGASREFEALREKKDIFAVYCGHDHKNSIVGTVMGIDLGYTPSCGFNEYGNGTKRAVREFVFHEEDPAAYETRLWTYRELTERRIASRPVKDIFYTLHPANLGEAKQMAGKAAAVAGMACAAGILWWLLSDRESENG